MSDDDKSRDAIYIDALHELANEQADRIQKLEADLETATMKRLLDSNRIEKLEAALRELSTDWDCCAVSNNMKLIARQALEGKYG